MLKLNWLQRLGYRLLNIDGRQAMFNEYLQNGAPSLVSGLLSNDMRLQVGHDMSPAMLANVIHYHGVHETVFPLLKDPLYIGLVESLMFHHHTTWSGMFAILEAAETSKVEKNLLKRNAAILSVVKTEAADLPAPIQRLLVQLAMNHVD
jgi:hypothetical protein